jgi:hypothetical protein
MKKLVISLLTQEIFLNFLKGIMKEPAENTMFDKNLMNHFYDSNYITNEIVLDAWFKYVYLFLPLVSKQWKDCVSGIRVKNQQIIFQIITVSDEALIQWLIELWFPRLDLKKNLNWPKEGKSTGKGKHDIKEKRNEYAIIHSKLDNVRTKIENILLWNKKFWDMLSERKSELFEKKNIDRPNRSLYKDMEIPLPGLNEDQDYSCFIKK